MIKRLSLDVLCVPSDSMVALATGLSAVLLFLLLIGLTAYLLWKKRQDQRRDGQLISTNPVIPPCTPVLQTLQSSNYGCVSDFTFNYFNHCCSGR